MLLPSVWDRLLEACDGGVSIPQLEHDWFGSLTECLNIAAPWEIKKQSFLSLPMDVLGGSSGSPLSPFSLSHYFHSHLFSDCPKVKVEASDILEQHLEQCFPLSEKQSLSNGMQTVSCNAFSSAKLEEQLCWTYDTTLPGFFLLTPFPFFFPFVLSFSSPFLS